MANVRYGCFEPSFTCPNCGSTVLIMGPVRTIRCAVCDTQIDIPPDAWFSILECLDEDYHELDRCEGHTSCFSEGTLPFEIGAWRMNPRCGKCKTDLEMESVETGRNGVVTCPDCKQEMDTFPAPDWLKEIYPATTQVFGGQRYRSKMSLEAGGAESKIINCPKCGGSIEVTEKTERVTPCGYCGVSVYLPENVYLALHPVPTFKEWFLRLEGISHKQIMRDQEARNTNRGRLKGKSPPPFDLGDPPARFGRFELLSECDHCGKPLMLNGPMRKVHCRHCLKDNYLNPDFWKSVVHTLEEKYYEDLTWGLGFVGTLWSGTSVKFRSYREVPACSKCGSILESMDVESGNDGKITCSECGVAMDTYPAPDWLKEVHPAVDQVFGADREENGQKQGVSIEVDEFSSQPLVFACPQCSSALEITSNSDRIFPCDSCNTDVYLPEGLWRRMHPVETARAWYLRFIGPTVKQLQEQEEKEETARKGEIHHQKAKPFAKVAWTLIPLTLLIWLLLVALININTFSSEPIGLPGNMLFIYVLGAITFLMFLPALFFTLRAIVALGETDWVETAMLLIGFIVPVFGLVNIYIVYPEYRE